MKNKLSNCLALVKKCITISKWKNSSNYNNFIPNDLKRDDFFRIKENIRLVVNNTEYQKTPPRGKLVLIASNGKIIEEALKSMAA